MTAHTAAWEIFRFPLAWAFYTKITFLIWTQVQHTTSRFIAFYSGTLFRNIGVNPALGTLAVWHRSHTLIQATTNHIQDHIRKDGVLNAAHVPKTYMLVNTAQNYIQKIQYKVICVCPSSTCPILARIPGSPAAIAIFWWMQQAEANISKSVKELRWLAGDRSSG